MYEYTVLTEILSTILGFCQLPECRNYSLVKLKIEINQPTVAAAFHKPNGGNFILITTSPTPLFLFQVL